MDNVSRSVWLVHHEGTKDTKGSEICDSNCRRLRGEIGSSKGQPQGIAPTNFKNEFSASVALLSIKICATCANFSNLGVGGLKTRPPLSSFAPFAVKFPIPNLFLCDLCALCGYIASSLC